MPAQLALFDRPGGVRPARVGDAVHALAGRLPTGLHLGTSSWSFPGWRGLVYERHHGRERLAREGLAAYAQHPLLRCVGLDRTYYAPLAAEEYARYAAAVPPDFRFVVKAEERLTVARFPRHARYGARAGEANPDFLDAGLAARSVIGPATEGLGPKLGVIVFQLPPQARMHPAELADRLHAFLTRLPRGPAYAVEIRVADWLTDHHAAALAAAGAVHCLTVHPSMPGLATQAACTRDARAGPLVVRWMLGGGQRYEDARERYAPFDRLVDEDPASRAGIAGLCAEAAEAGRAAYVVINNKAEGSAPLSARRLAEACAGG